MTAPEQPPAPNVCDADVPWPPQASLQPGDLQGFAWAMATSAAQIRALTEAGEMLLEQVAALKARDAERLTTIASLEAMLADDPRRTATLGTPVGATAKNGAKEV